MMMQHVWMALGLLLCSASQCLVAQSPKFAGEWATIHGPMTLTQKGRAVTGTCGYDGKIKVRGVAKGSKYEIELTGGQQGSGEFELWKGGDQFAGEVKLKSGDTAQWRGYRIEPKIPKIEPGKIVSGQAKSTLNFHLRVPKRFDARNDYPAIAFFHGSNMTSLDYIGTIVAAWPKLAEDYVLVGFDGEFMSGNARPGNLAFNFSYVNFSGPGNGPDWVKRQSPALVAEALQELRQELPIRHWIIGGHSQGGFLTYAVAMYYPELVVGALPMSCGLLVQCEPDNFSKSTAQRQIAFAPIHGINDPVVEFSSGDYGYKRFVDENYPRLRFFTDPNAAHMFARLPFEDAVRWVESMVEDDASKLLEFAETSLADERYRDACAALERARGLEGAERAKAEIDALAARIDAVARPQAEALEKSIRADRDGAWVEDFLKFRREFALAPAAAEVMEAYMKLRAKHAKPAEAAFQKARGSDDDAKRQALYREIVEQYYASKWYELVRGWLK